MATDFVKAIKSIDSKEKKTISFAREQQSFVNFICTCHNN